MACSGHGPTVPDSIEGLPYVVKVSGDNQVAPVGQRYPTRFSVQLNQDAFRLSTWNGQLVTFSSPGTGPSGEFISEGLQTVQLSQDRRTAWVQSGESGSVSSPPFQANDTVGTFEVKVSAFYTYVSSKPGSVMFSATNQAPTPGKLEAPDATSKTGPEQPSGTSGDH